jgi:hypothetical protein
MVKWSKEYPTEPGLYWYYGTINSDELLDKFYAVPRLYLMEIWEDYPALRHDEELSAFYRGYYPEVNLDRMMANIYQDVTALGERDLNGLWIKIESPEIPLEEYDATNN